MTQASRIAIYTITLSLIVLFLIPLGMYLTEWRDAAKDEADKAYSKRRDDSIAAIENNLATMPLPRFIDTILNDQIIYHTNQLYKLPAGADSNFCRAMWIYTNASKNNFNGIIEDYGKPDGDTVETFEIRNSLNIDDFLMKRWSEEKKDTSYILSATIFKGKTNCIKLFNNYKMESCFIFTRPTTLDSAGRDSVCESLLDNGLRVYLSRMENEDGCTISVQMIKKSSLLK